MNDFKSLKKMSLREIQVATLTILERINAICEALNIKYWLMYGSLLGAVRHKGFIPWDDDLDVAMFRRDYEIFCNYFLSNPKEVEPLELHTYKNKSDYPFYISRVTDPAYCLRFKDRKYTSGLFVDIYPFDAMGSDKRFWEKKRRKIVRLKKHLTLSCYPRLLYGKNAFNKMANLPNMVYSKIKGKLYFLNKMEQIEQRFNLDDSIYVSVPVWDPELWFFKKEWFKSIVKVKFENMDAPIPEAYDEILRARYGNYHELPPENERQPHHEYDAFYI